MTIWGYIIEVTYFIATFVANSTPSLASSFGLVRCLILDPVWVSLITDNSLVSLLSRFYEQYCILYFSSEKNDVFHGLYVHCLSTLSTVICVYYERLQQRRRLWTPWVRQCMYEYIEFNQIFQEKWIRLSQLKPKVKNNFLQFWRKIYNSFNIFSYIKSHQQWLKFMIWIF